MEPTESSAKKPSATSPETSLRKWAISVPVCFARSIRDKIRENAGTLGFLTGIGAFYTGLKVTMGATFFQHVAIYVVFVQWAAIIRATPRRFGFLLSGKKPQIIYDGRCPLCIRSMTVLRYFDWYDRLSFRDLEFTWQSVATTHPELSLENCRREMHILLPDCSVRKGFFAFREAIPRRRYLRA